MEGNTWTLNSKVQVARALTQLTLYYDDIRTRVASIGVSSILLSLLQSLLAQPKSNNAEAEQLFMDLHLHICNTFVNLSLSESNVQLILSTNGALQFLCNSAFGPLPTTFIGEQANNLQVMYGKILTNLTTHAIFRSALQPNIQKILENILNLLNAKNPQIQLQGAKLLTNVAFEGRVRKMIHTTFKKVLEAVQTAMKSPQSEDVKAQLRTATVNLSFPYEEHYVDEKVAKESMKTLDDIVRIEQEKQDLEEMMQKMQAEISLIDQEQQELEAEPEQVTPEPSKPEPAKPAVKETAPTPAKATTPATTTPTPVKTTTPAPTTPTKTTPVTTPAPTTTPVKATTTPTPVTTTQPKTTPVTTPATTPTKTTTPATQPAPVKATTPAPTTPVKTTTPAPAKTTQTPPQPTQSNDNQATQSMQDRMKAFQGQQTTTPAKTTATATQKPATPATKQTTTAPPAQPVQQPKPEPTPVTQPQVTPQPTPVVATPQAEPQPVKVAPTPQPAAQPQPAPEPEPAPQPVAQQPAAQTTTAPAATQPTKSVGWATASHEPRAREATVSVATNRKSVAVEELNKARSRTLAQKASMMQVLQKKDEELKKLKAEQEKLQQKVQAAQPAAPASGVDEQMHKKRTMIVQELVATEKSYVNSLDIMIKKFQIPMSCHPLVKPEVIKAIFSNIQVIHNYNSLLLDSLSNRLISWGPAQLIGDVMIKSIENFHFYTEYVTNFNNASNVLSQVRNNSQIEDLVNRLENDPQCAGLDLPSFLIMPVQRIPRYSLLLADLIKNTPDTHPDHKNLVQALEKTKSLAATINETQREMERSSALLSIQSRFKGETVLVPGRHLLREGPVRVYRAKSQKAREGALYVFNDCVMVAKKKKNHLKLLHKMPMPGTKATVFADSNEYSGPDLEFAFTVFGGNETVICVSSSRVEKHEWVEAINYMRETPRKVKSLYA